MSKKITGNQVRVHSTRQFTIAECENGRMEICELTLQEILDPKVDLETVFALQDQIDRLLDLKSGESMYIQPNRDNSESKCIILRTH